MNTQWAELIFILVMFLYIKRLQNASSWSGSVQGRSWILMIKLVVPFELMTVTVAYCYDYRTLLNILAKTLAESSKDQEV